jgi:hypothetical protein
LKFQNIASSEIPAKISGAQHGASSNQIDLRLRGAHVDKGVLALPVVLDRVQLSPPHVRGFFKAYRIRVALFKK